MYIDQPVGKWISRLYKHHEQYITDKLSGYNLKHSEANLLMHLYHHHDGINQEQLRENLGVDKATISRAVKGLLEKDYLDRERSPDDGRVYLIYLSEKARKHRTKIEKVYQDWFTLIMGDIPDAEVEIIIRNLKKMYKLACNEL